MTMSKMFQSNLLKIISCLTRRNSEITDQHIFLIVHGAHFVSEDDAEIDSTSEWTVVQIDNMMTFLDSRLTILILSFMKMKR